MKLTGNYDSEFVIIPNAIIFPGNQEIKQRLNDIDLIFDAGKFEITEGIVTTKFEITEGIVTTKFELNPIEIHNEYIIRLSDSLIIQSGTLILTFLDCEDKSILNFIDDWYNGTYGEDGRRQFKKCDVVADAKITLLDSSRGVVVSEIILHSLFPIDVKKDNVILDESKELARLSLLLKFDYFEIKEMII